MAIEQKYMTTIQDRLPITTPIILRYARAVYVSIKQKGRTTTVVSHMLTVLVTISSLPIKA